MLNPEVGVGQCRSLPCEQRETSLWDSPEKLFFFFNVVNKRLKSTGHFANSSFFPFHHYLGGLYCGDNVYILF